MGGMLMTTAGWYPVLVRVRFALQSLPHPAVPCSVYPDFLGPRSRNIWQGLDNGRNSWESVRWEEGTGLGISLRSPSPSWVGILEAAASALDRPTGDPDLGL